MTPPPSRRNFWQLALTLGLGSVAAALFTVPYVGFLFGSLRRRQPSWVTLGPLGHFPLRETRLTTFDNPLQRSGDGAASRTSVYVRNLGDEQFLVFAVNCTHLGCPVSWFPQSGLYMCPCHGGVYYENGAVAAGPPPRGLFQCEWRVRDGQLEIQAPHLPTLQNTLKGKRTNWPEL